MARVALTGSRLPMESYASILNVLDDRSEVKAFRLSIPILGLWSMKPLFADVCISIDPTIAEPSERLRFLAGLPDTWIRCLEIRFTGSNAGEVGISEDNKSCLQSLLDSRVLKSVCFAHVTVDIAKELLDSRKGRSTLDVLYIVMPEQQPHATAEQDEYQKWLEAILALPLRARPKRVNAGWGWIPQRLPVEQMRLLKDAGTVCEPLEP